MRYVYLEKVKLGREVGANIEQYHLPSPQEVISGNNLCQFM